MNFVRSIFFNIYILVFSSIVSIIFLPFMIFNDNMVYRAGKIWAIGIKLGLKYICSITHEVIDNKYNYHKYEKAIYVLKHESAWETIMFFLFAERPSYVLKKELLWIPFLNFYFKKIGIVIDRKAGAKALNQLVNSSKKRIENGHQIVIFPEGTRIKHGVKGKINPGIYSLYKADLGPIIPVALNSGKVWARNAFIKKPGVIHIKFFDPVPENLNRAEFITHIDNKINYFNQVT